MENFHLLGSNLHVIWLCLGAVHILRQPPEGGGGVSQKLTIADEGRGGQKKCQQKEFKGTKNVERENN